MARRYASRTSSSVHSGDRLSNMYGSDVDGRGGGGGGVDMFMYNRDEEEEVVSVVEIVEGVSG